MAFAGRGREQGARTDGGPGSSRIPFYTAISDIAVTFTP